MAHSRAPVPSVRIGIARDESFGFYYPDDLAALEAAGACLVPFDTLRDARLPTVDGLFIGGGFPEMALAGLEANASLRADLRAAIAAGLPTYAECGGLMYLARSIRWGDRNAQMVGAIPGDVVMHDRPVGRGYVQVAETRAFSVAGMAAADTVRRGHEFHHSSLENLPPDVSFAYEVQRGHGIDGRHDGVLVDNLLASYAHLRHCAGNPWPQRFVAFVRSIGRPSQPRPTHGPRWWPERRGNDDDHRDADTAHTPPAPYVLVNGTPIADGLRGLPVPARRLVGGLRACAWPVREELVLTEEHWEVIRFLRSHFAEHGVQAQVRVMIRHFAPIWGPQRGNNHHLHAIFPRGGPQKQGNRLAGLLRTKGEH